ncbi:hypothetical protein GUJ93_ZPchr0007g4460 [Zizania palustris]|uniref:RING-type domain-containing protein n=1 Tax=Zizania palustris TaxID=103762 RepID=A0A8J5T5Y8_ZIZPA|nr:hypothetical protein GUJ93_ZPchr0007g4460 [Zizania palustris]
MGGSVVGRAVIQAYRQAIVNANKTGAAQEAIHGIRRVSKAMTEQEARQILGIGEHSTWEEISQKYDTMFEKNAKNGSFYLQSKARQIVSPSQLAKLWCRPATASLRRTTLLISLPAAAILTTTASRSCSPPVHPVALLCFGINPSLSLVFLAGLPEHYWSCGFQGRGQPKFIPDNYSSVDEVTTALRDAGLESSNLILGIDFTKSNEWSGRYSFGRKSLHAINGTPNPYEQAISIIGRTLSPFDDDNLIPCFGFGDASTHDHSVFSFYPENRSCHGFEEVLERYRKIVPHLNLSGPTSFAPLIYAAISVVENNNWQYHVLVIIADGQVTTTNTKDGKLSPQEQATILAIVDASYYPLSIVMVGVGDGPWDAMKHFDDSIPDRAFDNFQFVNFTDIMSTSKDMPKKEAAFALAALMEIPSQYKATQGLRPPERPSGHAAGLLRILPPPNKVLENDKAEASHPLTASSQSTGSGKDITDEQVCPICLTNPKDMAFQCGHLTCKECGPTLSTCPLCRVPITMRIYSNTEVTVHSLGFHRRQLISRSRSTFVGSFRGTCTSPPLGLRHRSSVTASPARLPSTRTEHVRTRVPAAAAAGGILRSKASAAGSLHPNAADRTQDLLERSVSPTSSLCRPPRRRPPTTGHRFLAALGSFWQPAFVGICN